MVEMTTSEQNEERGVQRNGDNLRDLQDNIKCTNIYIINIPEGGEREKGPKKIFKEIIGENFPNMRKKTFTKVKEAQSSIQDKLKEEQFKTHINQIDKN